MIAWTQHFVPTSSLIHDVVHGRGSMNTPWDLLRSRNLSPEQERRLAEGILDKWVAEDRLRVSSREWLENTIRRGVLPEDLMQRFCQEAFQVWIEAPGEARVGEPFRVSLGSRFRRRGPLRHELYAYLGGVQFGQPPKIVGRQNRIFSCFFMKYDEGQPVSAQITAREPGPLELELHVWFVIDLQRRKSVTWKADGSPVIPSTAKWSEHRIATHTVAVRE